MFFLPFLIMFFLLQFLICSIFPFSIFPFGRTAAFNIITSGVAVAANYNPLPFIILHETPFPFHIFLGYLFLFYMFTIFPFSYGKYLSWIFIYLLHVHHISLFIWKIYFLDMYLPFTCPLHFPFHMENIFPFLGYLFPIFYCLLSHISLFIYGKY